MKILLALSLVAPAVTFGGAFAAAAPLRHPPLGVNASWLGDKVAEGALFVARATTYGFVDEAVLENLRKSVFAPYYEAQQKREPQLSLRGDGGATARPEDGVVDWLLGSMGKRIEGGDTIRDVRLSAVLRLEKLFKEDASDAVAAAAVEKLVGKPVFDMDRGDTAHVYVSAAGAAALANHTDPYDVVVLQIAGSKEWKVCAPLAPSPKSGMCATYDDTEMAAAVGHCDTITLFPGDLLFVPRGSVHSARAPPTGGSTHLTLGIRGREALRAAACAAEKDGSRRRLECSVWGTYCPLNTFSPTGYVAAAACDECDDCNIFGANCDSCDWGCDSCTACTECAAGKCASAASFY